MSGQEYIYQLNNVSRIYTQGSTLVHAIDDVSLNVKKGEFTAFVGPSGSGKTTLFNMMGALDLPDRGAIFFGEKEISKLSEKERAWLRLNEMGFVFQAYNLLPVLTAKENVEYILTLRDISETERARRALEMLEVVGLHDLADRFPSQLSGGQQQRVSVARAMVGNPRVVLADEPTANLDSETANDLLLYMEKLNKEFGTTFLFSTHDPRVMEKAHNVIRLVDGKISNE